MVKLTLHKQTMSNMTEICSWFAAKTADLLFTNPGEWSRGKAMVREVKESSARFNRHVGTFTPDVPYLLEDGTSPTACYYFGLTNQSIHGRIS